MPGPTLVAVAADIALLVRGPDAAPTHVLLVQRANEPFRGSWVLPGGFLDPDDDDVVDAAVRELREETGVVVGPDDLRQFGAHGARDRDPRGRNVSVGFVGELPTDAEPVGGDDAADARVWALADLDLDGSGRGEPLGFDHRHLVTAALREVRAGD